jgi:hypothetical protein
MDLAEAINKIRQWPNPYETSPCQETTPPESGFFLFWLFDKVCA